LVFVSGGGGLGGGVGGGVWGGGGGRAGAGVVGPEGGGGEEGEDSSGDRGIREGVEGVEEEGVQLCGAGDCVCVDAGRWDGERPRAGVLAAEAGGEVRKIGDEVTRTGRERGICAVGINRKEGGMWS